MRSDPGTGNQPARRAAVTWSQLQTFVAVADTGSARRAAEALYVTESAVSSAVATLQRALGVALVERAGRGLRLTPAGRLYADYARRVIGLLGQAHDAVLAVDSPSRGKLRIAAVGTAGDHVAPALLAKFHKEFPGVEITLTIGVQDRILESLISYEADVVIGGDAPQQAEIACRGQRPNQLVVVASPSGDRDWRRGTWLLREEGSGTRAASYTVFGAAGLQPRTLTVGPHGAVVAAARLGLGIALISRDAAQRDLDDGTLIQLDVPGTPLQRPWRLLTNRVSTSTADLFVNFATNKGMLGSLAFTSSAVAKIVPESLPVQRPLPNVGLSARI